MSHRPYNHNQVNGNAAIDCRCERNRKRLGSTALTHRLQETPAEALQTIPVLLNYSITFINGGVFEPAGNVNVVKIDMFLISKGQWNAQLLFTCTLSNCQ